MYGSLRAKLSDGSLVVGVIGLGYVGTPLALAFSHKYRVLGFDIRPDLVQALRKGEGQFLGTSREDLVRALDSRFLPTTDLSRLEECDVFVIAVGTPLAADHDPDLSQIEDAAREVARRLRPGKFIVLESTSYPGTTEEILVPILESGGLRAGVDFGVAFSPERIDPGNPRYRIQDIPKLVGGLDEASTQFAHALYSQVIGRVIPVSHARVAEAAKIIENLFRAVNIALVNEVSLILERLDIDAWEAIDAASTKPFGFMPFYPGPGVGGHCIPLDPYYLSYRARKAGHLPQFIELSGNVNEYMRFHTVNLLRRGLEEAGKTPAGATVAILGLSFKRNIADTRESPAIRVIEECLKDGMTVRAYDPHASSISTRKGTVMSEPDADSAVAGADATVILVDHDAFTQLDFDSLSRLMESPPVWIDTRNVLRVAPRGSVALGIGRPLGRVRGGMKPPLDLLGGAEPQAAPRHEG
ncbi:MAG: hypothetical protein A3K59_05345 [Euryarchaeota archaeon RBG_19FT_COMBO_69_17]|nr:MAG: hypothetical protein A3K59_05345 [Euryarchaeota archaeon RBG_19FT_COMBO_69_17]